MIYQHQQNDSSVQTLINKPLNLLPLELLFKIWQEFSLKTFVEATQLSSLVKANDELSELFDSVLTGKRSDQIYMNMPTLYFACYIQQRRQVLA